MFHVHVATIYSYTCSSGCRVDSNGIDYEIWSAIYARTDENKEYVKKLQRALITPVGHFLKKNGFERLAIAFFEEKIISRAKAAKLTQTQFAALGATAVECKQLEKIFARYR